MKETYHFVFAYVDSSRTDYQNLKGIWKIAVPESLVIRRALVEAKQKLMTHFRQLHDGLDEVAVFIGMHMYPEEGTSIPLTTDKETIAHISTRIVKERIEYNIDLSLVSESAFQAELERRLSNKEDFTLSGLLDVVQRQTGACILAISREYFHEVAFDLDYRLDYLRDDTVSQLMSEISAKLLNGAGMYDAAKDVFSSHRIWRTFTLVNTVSP